MSVHSHCYPNLYKDSVSLMTVSAKLSAVPGIDAASVVMASATNVENLARAGLAQFDVAHSEFRFGVVEHSSSGKHRRLLIGETSDVIGCMPSGLPTERLYVAYRTATDSPDWWFPHPTLVLLQP